MTGIPINGDQFVELVTSVTVQRVHFEVLPSYDVPEEAGELDAWLDAMRHHRQPRTPPEIGWWADYLADAQAMHDRGVELIRIRVVDDPMTDYQRWSAWAAPWHAAVGEQVYYLRRQLGAQLGMHVIIGQHDWDLLDDERVITTWFNAGGAVLRRKLLTDPGTLATYRALRDRAIANATAAAPAAA